MIKNIILDVGRVLVAWHPKETMKDQLGFEEETVKVLSKALFDSGAWNETDRGVLSDEEFLDLIIGNAPEYEKEIRLFWENIDLAIEQFSYSKSFVQAMKAAGYHVYILSNYGSWTYQKTREDALNFLDEVDGAIFSYEVHQIKPSAEIYHTLFEKFNLKPEECIFLDDLVANIEGAKEVGMHGIVFKGLESALEELKEYGVNLKVTVLS